MTSTGRLGLLGGTFDPFHNGHLAVALAARTALALDAVHVIPAHVPPHRPEQPSASPEHRFAMVALGIAATDGLLADDRELRASGPSYTSRTLASYAAEGWEASQLFFLIGADAFAEIATWHDYPALLDGAHFVVVSRPGADARVMRARLPGLASRMRDLAPAGPAGTDALGQPAIWLMHAETPDVSATAIRELAAAGRVPAGLTPPLVEQHIARHGLYRQTTTRSLERAVHEKAASELHAQEHS